MGGATEMEIEVDGVERTTKSDSTEIEREREHKRKREREVEVDSDYTAERRR